MVLPGPVVVGATTGPAAFQPEVGFAAQHCEQAVYLLYTTGLQFRKS